MMVMRNGKLESTNWPVVGSCVGHNCRIGAGLVFYPGRAIESDTILVRSDERAVITKNVTYEQSDHHPLDSATTCIGRSTDRIKSEQRRVRLDKGAEGCTGGNLVRTFGFCHPSDRSKAGCRAQVPALGPVFAVLMDSLFFAVLSAAVHFTYYRPRSATGPRPRDGLSPVLYAAAYDDPADAGRYRKIVRTGRLAQSWGPGSWGWGHSPTSWGMPG